MTDDEDPYTGITQDVDAESCTLVKMMSCVGANRLFWPMREDIVWYQQANVLAIVPEPHPLTKQHMMLDGTVCKEICSLVNLYGSPCGTVEQM